MAPTNRASWLMTKQAPVNTVSTAPYTPPSTNELVIKLKAVAMNPVDVGVQKFGIIVTQYPAILGCDAAGEVVEVHPSLSEMYKVGDRVIGTCSCMETKDGVYCYSAFQEYPVLKAPFIAKVPEKVAFEDAVVLPLAVNTAGSCLFGEVALGLELPTTGGSQAGQSKTLIIWGASSSVGSCGVQMGVQAGYEVVGVASKRNHGMVKSLGASECFDQSDATIVDDMVKYLEGKEVVGAYCAIADEGAYTALCDILSRCNGKKLVAAVMPGAEEKGTKGVKIVTNFPVVFDKAGWDNKVGKAVWTWVEKAMQDESVKYMPQKEVVGKGLEEVQQAVDLLGKGVSAKKLVVSM